MKQLKWVYLPISLLVLISLVSGCGVDKAEHEKTVAELQKTQAQLQKAQAEIAGLKKAQSSALKVDPKLQENLDKARQKIKTLSRAVEGLNLKNDQLKAQTAKLQGVIADLEKKLQAFKEQTKGLPIDPFKQKF